MRILYGCIADELAVRFASDRGHSEIVVPVTTSGIGDAGLLLAAVGDGCRRSCPPPGGIAIQWHTSGGTAPGEDPAPEVAGQTVVDIRDLFDRYGVEDPRDEP
jgi:hypothetical protein